MSTSKTTPIDELGYDILALVFAALAVADPPRAASSAGPARLGWIHATHVSRGWRTVGLQCATLWADIATVFPQGKELIAARASQAPVVLDLRAIRDQAVRIWFVEQFLGRPRIIKDYYSVGGDEETFWARQKLPGRRLSSLESFELHYSHPYEVGIEGVQTESLSTLIPLNAPILTHATLTMFISLLAPRLRVLVADTDWKLTLPETVEYLGRFPNLEELDLRLKIAEAPRSHAITSPTPNVHLSHLRSFTNESDDFSIVRLLDHVSFPATTKVHVYLGPTYAEEQEPAVRAGERLEALRALCQAVSSQLKEASRNQLIIAECDGATHLSVVPRASSPAEDLIPAIERGVTLGGGFELYFEGALAIVAAEVGHGITSLLIQEYKPNEMTLVDFPELHHGAPFRELVVVEELIIRHCAQRICRVFEGNPPPLFPALQRIVLDFTVREGDDDSDETHDAQWLDHLRNMLASRHRATYPAVREVTLIGLRDGLCAGASQCFALTDAHIQALEAVVGNVTDLRV